MDKEKIEADFLKVLSAYLHDGKPPALSNQEVPPVMNLALRHNLTGVFLTALYEKNSIEKRFKTAALSQMTAQVRKTFRFFEFYNAAIEKISKPICVKGITLRRLWKEPDLRNSSDEDLIIEKSDFAVFKAVMLKNDFKLESENETQLRFCDTRSPLILEVQSKPFCEQGDFGKRLDEIFENYLLHTCSVEVFEKSVCTLSETFNLLYLICHAFKHFIRSGVGIRQLCDILIFAKAFDKTIDYNFVFSSLEKISADVFAREIFGIGVLYLGFEREDFSFDFSVDEPSCKKLCRDVLAAGVFGTADRQRLHSASLTYDAVLEKKTSESLFKRVFPEKEVIFSRYEKAREHKSLYLFYCMVRLREFFCEKNSSAKGVLSEAKKRKELLESLEITAPHGSFLSCDSRTVEAMKRELESGKSVKLKVTGSSMAPFLIGGRDEVILERPGKKLKVGDIVFYRRKSGRFVLHRIAKIRGYNFYAVGDAQSVLEGPIEKEMIIAVCTGAVRCGKTIGRENNLWRFFSLVWIRTAPFRSGMLKAYSALKTPRKKKRISGVEKSD